MCDDKGTRYLIKLGVRDSGEVYEIVSWWSSSVQAVVTRKEEAMLSVIVHELAVELGSVLDRAARVVRARADRVDD